uniref:Uncharacterized protein n=1 Tax=Aegilops tauschii subsp. strangulata TaxID=200361 RepID=A0A452Z859_AEGTS
MEEAEDTKCVSGQAEGGIINAATAARTRRVELQLQPRPWEKLQATANKERQRRLHSTAQRRRHLSLQPGLALPPPHAHAHGRTQLLLRSLCALCLSPGSLARGERKREAREVGDHRSGGFCLVERPQAPPRPNHRASAFFRRAPLPRWRPNHLLSASLDPLRHLPGRDRYRRHRINT